MLLVVEIEIGLPDHHHAFRVHVFRVLEPALKPRKVRRFASDLFGALTCDLGRIASFTVDAGVGKVVV